MPQPTNSTARTAAKPKSSSFNIADFCMAVLTKWYWIVLCVIIALGVAYLQVKRTTPTYTRSAKLLIKTEDQQEPSIPDELKTIGVGSSVANISNEINTITAPVLSEEVVKRLHLDVNMAYHEGLHLLPLYDEAPFTVALPQTTDDQTFAFKMKVSPNRTAQLFDFSADPEKYTEDAPFSAKVGDILRTPVGLVIIKPTQFFSSHATDKVILVTKSSVKSVAATYCGGLAVTLADKDATILDISLTNASKQRAADFILKLIEVYNERWLEDRNHSAESSYAFITDRLNTLAKELGDVDQQISDYKSSTLLPDPDAAANMYMSESAKNNDQILNLNVQLSIARDLRRYLAADNHKGQYLPTNSGIGSTGIETMISAYNEKVSQRNELVVNSSESSPYVKQADKELTMMRQTIIRSLDNLITLTQSQVADWERNSDKTNAKLASAPRQVKQLLSIGRQQKVKETLYIFLLQKREENELSKSYNAANTRIIQPPIGSNAPTAPVASTMYLIALAAGVVIPVAIIYLLTMMDHYVRGRADLDGMSVPLLGEIPNLSVKRHFWQRNKRDARRDVYVKANSRDLINEAFRVLRTKLDYYMGSIDGDAKVIMLTSFNPGSGKSFITANLAKVLSLKGARVLAVDMDFRHYSLSSITGQPHHGITDVLSGVNDNYDELIKRDAFGEDADLLAVGVVPPNPTEMMLSPRLEKLIAALRDKYDYIILDCPPIDVVADTSIVKKYSDVALFVVRAGLMDRNSLKDVDELYTSGAYKHMALLLNGTAYVSSRYGNYRYGYSYGYSYAYGYASKK